MYHRDEQAMHLQVVTARMALRGWMSKRGVSATRRMMAVQRHQDNSTFDRVRLDNPSPS